MLNRAALIPKYKEPFVRWINEADPYKHEDTPKMTLEEVNQERTVYLITEDEADHLEEWLNLNYRQLLESELEGWYTDEALWPEKRDRELFDQWMTVECHATIIDTVGEDLFDEEI